MKIGIFDSGLGGLTVARELRRRMPEESIVYLGDTARQPYGPKPISEVREYALECLDHLVARGVKALVIACNSASVPGSAASSFQAGMMIVTVGYFPGILSFAFLPGTKCSFSSKYETRRNTSKYMVRKSRI